jgi:hypothetical protein
MTLSPSSARRTLAVALIAALWAAGCAPATDPATTGGPGRAGDTIAAEVASFDLVARRADRFIIGVWSVDQTTLLAYGTIELTFTHLDEPEASADPPSVTARFLPLPGQDIDPAAPGPRFVSGAEATGVYGSPDVTFGQPGFWEVTVTATVDGQHHSTTAAFEVHERSDIPAVGDPAPRTRQPLAGDPHVGPRSIYSRAGPGQPIPVPGLHDITIADAIDAGLPVMVVISTPTYCVSRFCGPITDIIYDLALRHRGDMAFVHLEVWADFENQRLNSAALEWIAPTDRTNGGEPWVFVIDRHGIISHRFDNVATDAELQQSIRDVLS